MLATLIESAAIDQHFAVLRKQLEPRQSGVSTPAVVAQVGELLRCWCQALEGQAVELPQEGGGPGVRSEKISRSSLPILQAGVRTGVPSKLPRLGRPGSQGPATPRARASVQLTEQAELLHCNARRRVPEARRTAEGAQDMSSYMSSTID